MQKMEDEVKDLEEDDRWSRKMLEMRWKGNTREREGKPVEEEERRKATPWSAALSQKQLYFPSRKMQCQP